MNAGRIGLPLQIKKAECAMKSFSRLTVLAILALCSIAAFAGNKQTTYLRLFQPATIAGVKVPAGEYKLVVERDGANAKVALMDGGKKIVEADAHFVELKSFVAPTAVVTEANSNVVRIEISKMKGAVVFDPATPNVGGK